MTHLNSTVFCVDDFWISELLWNNQTPKLTKCLGNVGVTILPNFVLLTIALFEFRNINKSTNNRINLNKYNVTRFLICLFAIVSNFITLLTYGYSIAFSDHNSFTISDFLASFSKLAIALFLAIISYFHRTRGIITSGIIFVVLCFLFTSSSILLIDAFLYNASMYAEFEKQNILRNFLCILSLFFLSCFADDAVKAGIKPDKNNKNLLQNIVLQPISEEDKETEAQICPKKYCSFLSRLTFYWYTKFVNIAAKRKIELKDIWEVEDNMKVEPTSEQFNVKYLKELENIENSNRYSNKKRKLGTWSCIKIIWKVYGVEYLGITFVKLGFDFLNFVGPKLLSKMINFVKHDQPVWHGILIVIGLIVSSFIKNILINMYFEYTVGLGIRIKTAFTNLIFSKSLKIAPKAKNKRTTGELVNLISIDVSRICEVTPFIAFLWSAPLQIGIAIYLLYEQLGNSLFIGILVIILILICNSVMLAFLKKFYLKEMKIKDERVKLVAEILSGIKIIKLYGWERAFIEKVKVERDKEVKCNKNILSLEVISFFFFSISPTLVLVSTIGVFLFSGIGSELTAEKVFVSISLFNILQFPVEILPVVFTYLTICKVSLDRMSSFLSEDELQNYVDKNYDPKLALSIRNKARFVYEIEQEVKKDEKVNDKKEKMKFKKSNKNGEDEIKLETNINNQQNKRPFELKDIELEVEKGKLIAIIGQVGSGKSSLISAILGEMHLIENDFNEKGKVNISEEQNICYVAQQAWIQNNTFKENILFGKLFDSEKYKDVIAACALETDLKQFEGGDQTEIGEKGINLSGGQKQRVSLARACYSSISVGNYNNIILLDDVLSAVDAHVGKHLCENVLNSTTGILKGTTRILVTNQLNQLSDLDVDQIVLLKDGKIELKCTYEELMDKERNGELEDYNLRLTQNDQSESKSNEDEKSASDSSETSDEEKKDTDKLKSNNTKLIDKEKQEIGRVDIKNYIVYLKFFGIVYAMLSLIFLIGDNFYSVYSREYLSEWTKVKLETKDDKIIKDFHKKHFQTYLIYSIIQCVFNLMGNILLVIGCVNTIKLFHKKLLYKIMRSPMCFFDTTPLGRIVNRFSKDQDAIDKALPRAIREFLLAFLNLCASFAVIIYKQPSSFIFYFLILVLYYFVLDLYVSSSRQLKRYESTTRSPIFSHFSETITGSVTIKAYNKVEEFEKESKTKIGINNRCNWYSFQGNRWLGFYLELLGSLILLIVSVQFLLSKETSNEGDVGLIISYALNITQFLTYVVRFYSLFETNAVSIERINEYCNNEEEDDWVKDVRPDADWPSKGEIEFIDYSTRYRKGTNLVLKNLSFKVNETEKVGIVGRTGSGKSTTTLALFRIIEPVNGRIIIDNLDISQIGLHDLRSKISIIPQDAVLFTGTIRFNLDPFDRYSEDEIYRSLEHSHLKDYINNLEDGIYHKISEGGENLSTGQKQLICLARALLRKSKILVLDEATASVDFVTDELVQQTIRSEFEECSTITIAHRLNTVLDSSRILVLEKGELKEYDKPDNLLKDTNSMFYKLASKANLV